MNLWIEIVERSTFEEDYLEQICQMIRDDTRLLYFLIKIEALSNFIEDENIYMVSLCIKNWIYFFFVKSYRIESAKYRSHYFSKKQCKVLIIYLLELYKMWVGLIIIPRRQQYLNCFHFLIQLHIHIWWRVRISPKLLKSTSLQNIATIKQSYFYNMFTMRYLNIFKITFKKRKEHWI